MLGNVHGGQCLAVQVHRELQRLKLQLGDRCGGLVVARKSLLHRTGHQHRCAGSHSARRRELLKLAALQRRV
jgi:hypothetical protein